MHQIEVVLGLTNASGKWYLWWSGFGATLRDLGFIVLVVWRGRKKIVVHHHHHYGDDRVTGAVVADAESRAGKGV